MSIDGHPDVQDAQRPAKSGKPMSETIAKWARSMLRIRPNADARLTISPAGVDRLYDSCIYLWEEIGFHSIVVGDAAYEDWTADDFQKYSGELDRIVDYLETAFHEGRPKRIAIMAYYIANLIMPRNGELPVARRNFPCGAGYNYSMIDHTGTIWPCHRFDGAAEDAGLEEDFKLGNIYSGEYKEHLSNAFRNFDHSKIYKPECKTCPVEPICGGFCPAANLQHSSNGARSIYTPHFSYCQLKWTMYEKSKKLYDRISSIHKERCDAFFREIAPHSSGEQ